MIGDHAGRGQRFPVGGGAAYLEEDDARWLLELLQAEPVKWRAPITFDLLSGLRRAELLGLRCLYSHGLGDSVSRFFADGIAVHGLFDGGPADLCPLGKCGYCSALVADERL